MVDCGLKKFGAERESGKDRRTSEGEDIVYGQQSTI